MKNIFLVLISPFILIAMIPFVFLGMVINLFNKDVLDYVENIS